MPNLEEYYTTKFFDRINAAITKLENRLDATNRRIGNLRAPPLPEPPPYPTSDPLYTQRTCRSHSPQSQSLPRTASYTSGLSSYFSPDTYDPEPYSCSDWDLPGVLSDYYESPHARSNSSRYSARRNAYRPPGVLSDCYEPPHARSNSKRYSTRQNAYRPPRNAFTSGDQFVEQERPLRQPHCGRQSPNSGWFSPESHQQQFVHAKKQTCWDPSSQTSGRRAPLLPEPLPPPTPLDLLCQQPQNRNQRPTFPSSRTPTRPQFVLDQKPPLQSDRLLKQPSTTSTIELPSYTAPSPCQPLLSLSVKAPLCASPRQPQAGVSSSRKSEWEIDSHDGEEKREEKLIVLTSLGNLREKDKESDYIAKREEGVNNIFLKLLEKENIVEALRSSLATKENVCIVLTEKPSKRESKEIQSLGDEHKARFEIKKQEKEEKRRMFEDELELNPEDFGNKGDAHTGSQALDCVYVDLNVTDVTSMNPRSPSLDADARLIPPGNNMSCLSIHGWVAELVILALNCHDNNVAGVSAISYIQHGSLLVIWGGNDEGRCSTLRCVFDPGGDVSPKLLLLTLVIASWFPP